MSESSYLTQDQELESLGDYTLKVSSPVMPPLYQTDYLVLFIVELKNSEQLLSNGKITYEFLWDQQDSIKTGEIDLTGEILEIPFSTKKPGFVVLKISYQFGDKVLHKSCGAGFGVEQLQPSADEPSDFNEFWDKQKEKLQAIPISSTMQDITHTSHPQLHKYSHKSLLLEDISAVDLSYVSVPCSGNPVEGVLTRPKNKTAKSHPVVLALHGAGVGPSQPHNFIDQAIKGAVIFEINAHGIPNDQDETYYDKLNKNELNNYSKRDFNSPEEFYFLDMFLRVKRGLDYLKTLPEWDGKRVFVRGNSQGGAQSLAGAYLDQDVTGFISLVPGFCDHTAASIGRAPGWPSLVPNNDEQTIDESKLKTLRYFDGVNFLKNISAEGLFAIGYLDGTCKPTSIYTAFNQHAAPKRMLHQPYSAHAIMDETAAVANQFMWDHFTDKQMDQHE